MALIPEHLIEMRHRMEGELIKATGINQSLLGTGHVDPAFFLKRELDKINDAITSIIRTKLPEPIHVEKCMTNATLNIKTPATNFSTPQQPVISIAGSNHILQIRGDDGTVLATIHKNGSIEYGKNYHPDDAARIFWLSLSQAFPGAIFPPEDPTQPEDPKDAYERAMGMLK